MKTLVDIIIEDERWQDILPAISERAIAAVLNDQGLAPDLFEVSVLGCDDARIKVLNASFREKDKATNVLSWPSQELGAEYEGERPDPPEVSIPDEPEGLGDIAISYDTCLCEADEQGKPFADHVMHLMIHGTLHLLGYDHIYDADAELMEAAEVRILDLMGISDPY